MNTTTPELMWPDKAQKIYEDLNKRGIKNPDGEQPFHVTDIDHAIQSAMEYLRLTEGWNSMPDMNEKTWWNIEDDVAYFLGIQYDELVEVIP